MKTFKFSFVLRSENTDVFITLDENIYGIHNKGANILYIIVKTMCRAQDLGTQLKGQDQIKQRLYNNMRSYSRCKNNTFWQH